LTPVVYRQTPLGHNPPCLLPFVGRLGSGPRLVGWIGSGVRVSVSFLQKYPPCSVLRCPTAAKNVGYDQGGCAWGSLTSSPAYNVEPATNTSSSSCANNGRRTPPWVLDARRRLSRLCFSHFATRTVDNTVGLYAAKPDIRPESRFLFTPPAFDAPVRGFLSEYRHPVWYEKTSMVGLPVGEKNWRYVYSFLHDQRTWQTDKRTDGQTPHDSIGRAYASHRVAKI